MGTEGIGELPILLAGASERPKRGYVLIRPLRSGSCTMSAPRVHFCCRLVSQALADVVVDDAGHERPEDRHDGEAGGKREQPSGEGNGCARSCPRRRTLALRRAGCCCGHGRQRRLARQRPEARTKTGSVWAAITPAERG